MLKISRGSFFLDVRTLEERLSGEAVQNTSAQAAVTAQVAALAESTTTFDEKIAAFSRTIRGDFRSTREELEMMVEERLQLVLEDTRARSQQFEYVWRMRLSKTRGFEISL